jgi:hypothetical protein
VVTGKCGIEADHRVSRHTLDRKQVSADVARELNVRRAETGRIAPVQLNGWYIASNVGNQPW